MASFIRNLSSLLTISSLVAPVSATFKFLLSISKNPNQEPELALEDITVDISEQQVIPEQQESEEKTEKPEEQKSTEKTYANQSEQKPSQGQAAGDIPVELSSVDSGDLNVGSGAGEDENSSINEDSNSSERSDVEEESAGLTEQQQEEETQEDEEQEDSEALQSVTQPSEPASITPEEPPKISKDGEKTLDSVEGSEDDVGNQTEHGAAPDQKLAARQPISDLSELLSNLISQAAE